MNRLFQRIAEHARRRPDHPALSDGRCALSYAEVQREITRLGALLEGQRVALLLGNGCAWALLDLAVQRSAAVCIPLPPFFSDAQLDHVLRDACADLVITDHPQRLSALRGMPPSGELLVGGCNVTVFRRHDVAAPALPAGTAKITYTSGTTGLPKGVCLSGTAMAEVTACLAHAVQAGAADRTLSLLPLSTLLENIGGLYAPLQAGAQAFLPHLGLCGIQGSSRVDPARLMDALNRFNPTSIIVVPQLLKVLTAAVAAGAPVPTGLRFIANGGARTSPALIARARELGLPVYEGYGLSEACSVVSLNLPGNDRPASTGRPLPHAHVRIAPDGEVFVGGTLFAGYLGQARNPARHEWATGDLGRLDEDGYLHITGRKRSAFCTAYGRNISPEWVEGELLASNTLIQAAVFGDGRPYNTAVLVPHLHATANAVSTAVAEANQRLPDYARVQRWVLADAPFSPLNGQASTSGAMRREAVQRAYANRIEDLYSGETTDAFV